MISKRQMVAGAVTGLDDIDLVRSAVYQEHRPELLLLVMNFHDRSHSVTVQLIHHGIGGWGEGLA